MLFASSMGVIALLYGGFRWIVAATRLSPSRAKFGPSWRDGWVIVAYVIVAFAIFRVTLHGSTFSPVTFSVDLAHHGGVVEWMRTSQVIPTSYVAELSGQSGYPAGSYTIAALLSWLIHLSPLQAMWLMAVGMVLSTWFIAGSIVEAIIGPAARPFFLVPIPIALAAWRFTIGMVSDAFFFAQLSGIWIAMSAVAAIVWWSRRNVHVMALCSVAALASLACLFTYPQAAPIPLLAFLLEATRGRFTKRSLCILSAGGAVSALAAFGFAQFLGFGMSLIAGAGEGARTPLTVAYFGGIVFIALFIVGLVELLVGSNHGPGSRAVLGAMLGPAILAVGLVSLRLPILGGYPVTDYRIQKNAYAIVPFAVVVATIAVVQSVAMLARTIGWAPQFGLRKAHPSHRFVNSAVAGLTALVVAGSIFSRAQRSAITYPIISRGEYQAMNWARANANPTDIAMAFAGLTGYQLWRMKSGRPAEEVHPSMRTQWRLARWDQWPNDNPERLLVTSGWLADHYSKVPGVKVRYRTGNAVVLERPESLDFQPPLEDQPFLEAQP